jgi:hypothetical protein
MSKGPWPWHLPASLESRWGLNHMQNSAGPSGQPCLLCAFHRHDRGEVCSRGVCGEGGARPQEGADKGQEAPDRGRRFCKALCQKSEGLGRTR